MLKLFPTTVQICAGGLIALCQQYRSQINDYLFMFTTAAELHSVTMDMVLIKIQLLMLLCINLAAV